MMKRRCLWLAIALMAALPVRAAEPRSDEAQLRELKLTLWPKAYREQDTALLDRILDASFQMTDGTGTVSTKAEELAWVRGNRPGYDDFRFDIERLEVFDGRSAVVSGLGTVRGRRDGEPYITRYRSTNVLIKRDGTWRAVASHVSMLPHPP